MPQVVTIKLMNHGELPLSSWSWRSILQKYVRLTRPFRAHYRPLLPKESIHKWCPMNLTRYISMVYKVQLISTTYLYIPIHCTKDCFLIAMLILWSSQVPILLSRASKGQLISKANSKVFIWTKNQRKYFCISGLASKSGQIRKI